MEKKEYLELLFDVTLFNEVDDVIRMSRLDVDEELPDIGEGPGDGLL